MDVGLPSLVIGAIDYYANLGPGVTAAIQGIPVKVVACYETHDKEIVEELYQLAVELEKMKKSEKQ